MNTLIIFFLISTFVCITLGCTSSCETCACFGYCARSKGCFGAGHRCFCEAEVSSVNEQDLAIHTLVNYIQDSLKNLTVPFVLPISNKLGYGFELKYENGQLEGYIVH